jgi:hypothetical protein
MKQDLSNKLIFLLPLSTSQKFTNKKFKVPVVHLPI